MRAPSRRRKQLVIQALLPLVVTGTWIVVLMWLIGQLAETAQWVDHTDKVIAQLRELDGLVDQQAVVIRGYLLTGDPDARAQFGSRRAFDSALTVATQLVSDNPPQIARAQSVASAYDRWFEMVSSTLALPSAVQPVTTRAAAVARADVLRDAIHDRVRAMREVEDSLLIERAGQADRMRRATILSTSLAGALLAVGLAAAAVRSLRSLASDYEQAQAELRQDAARIARAEAELRSYAAELEDRVRKRTADLERVNGQLQAFGYSISHDLRAPLRGVHGLAEALKEDYGDRLDPLGRRYVEQLAADAARMERLVADLLRYAQTVPSEAAVAPVPMADVLAAAEQNVASEVHAARGQVTIAPDLPVVMGHPPTLVQVFTNLLSNALKFGGERPSILVWAERRGPWIRVWVVDHGIGIDAADQSRIFNVFERLHGEASYPGNGIGLAIVRQGVEGLGGRVGVESAPGNGSHFWVELRAAPSEVAPDDSGVRHERHAHSDR